MDEEGDGRDWQDGKTRPRCKGGRRDGTRCAKEELPDLGYCFSCAPEELISQAEALTGRKRCTARVTSTNADGTPHAHTGKRCGRDGHPVCDRHGGSLPVVKRAAFEQILNRTAEQTLHEITAVERQTGMVMRSRPFEPVQNPFLELMDLAGEMKAFKDRIGARVDAMNIEEFRYEHERAGEQIRAEIMIYIKAMERLEACLTKIAKLGIEERMMRITERQAEIIEQALLRTLADAKYDLPAQIQKAMKDDVVRRLRVA
jgi:hypothetical protein